MRKTKNCKKETTIAQVWNNMGSPFAKALESCDSGTATIRAMLT